MELDSALITKAVDAIIRHTNKISAVKSKNSLFEDFPKPIIVQLQLTESISKTVVRPVRVKIPNTLFADDGSNTVCIFCRTDDKSEFEKIMADKTIPGLKTVLSIRQVKREYQTFSDRKTLLSEHTHFLCDPAIMNQLYNLLGNVFGARNKYPVPMKFDKFSKAPSAAMQALNSTYMHLKGENISIRLGHTGMSTKQVVENVICGLNFACEKLPNQWRSIHSIHIKSSDSASLPLYSKAKNDYLSFAQKISGVPTPASKKGKAAKKSDAVASKVEVEKSSSGGVAAVSEVKSAANTPAKKTEKVPQVAAAGKKKAITPEAVVIVEEKVAEAKNKKMSAKKTPVKKQEELTASPVDEEVRPAKGMKRSTSDLLAAVETADETSTAGKPPTAKGKKKAAKEPVPIVESEPVSKRTRRGRSESH